MTYCVKQDLIDRYGQEELIQLTDRANAGVIDDTVLDQAIADADSLIDGYLASRYSLPLSDVPVSLVRVAAALTRYFLYTEAATDQVEKAHDQAIAWLKDVARGTVNLGLSATNGKPNPADSAQVDSAGTVFGRKDKSFI